MDVSTGAFMTSVCSNATLLSELARIAPAELLMSSDMYDKIVAHVPEYDFLAPLLAGTCLGLEGCVLTRQERSKAVHPAVTVTWSSPTEQDAAGALLSYVEWTQQGRLPVLTTPRAQLRVLDMDAATRRSLELSAPINGKVCIEQSTT